MIFHTYIGTNVFGVPDLGNNLGGIYIGSCMSSTTIGGTSSPLQNIIADSGGPGVIIRASSGNTLLGNEIVDNAGNGVTIIKAKRLTVGGSASGAGNQIVTNQGYGVEASGVCTGSVVQGNAIVTDARGMSTWRDPAALPTFRSRACRLADSNDTPTSRPDQFHVCSRSRHMPDDALTAGLEAAPAAPA